MSFDSLFDFLALYLGILLLIALVGMFFAKKHKELNAEFEPNLSAKSSQNSAPNKKGEILNPSANAEFNENSAQKFSKKSAFKGLYKHCPCRKAVENGLMSSICVYSSVAGFMLSLTNIALVGIYSVSNFAVLALSVLCAYFGWVLKK